MFWFQTNLSFDLNESWTLDKDLEFFFFYPEDDPMKAKCEK